MSRPPGNMRGSDRDDGRDVARIYGAAERPEPPAAVDRAIREAAARPRRGHAWRHAMSVAAVVVLSATVLLILPRERFEEPEPEADARSEGAPPLRAPGAGAERQLERRSVATSDADSPEAGEAAVGRTRPAAEPAAPADRRDSPGLREEATTATAGRAAAPTTRAGEAYYRSSPELWIQHIERLLSEGAFDSADAEYQAFRERHPGHPYAQRR